MSVYRADPGVYRAFLNVYRADLGVYRAFLSVYWADLGVYRACSWSIYAAFSVCRHTHTHAHTHTHTHTRSLPQSQSGSVFLRVELCVCMGMCVCTRIRSSACRFIHIYKKEIVHIYDTHIYVNMHMGWLRFVGSLKYRSLCRL